MNARGHIISGALLALASTGTFAAELNAGTIHFTGQIIEPSCEIQGDDGTNSTVPLGTYPTSLFPLQELNQRLPPFPLY